jgi:hypothetical protein
MAGHRAGHRTGQLIIFLGLIAAALVVLLFVFLDPERGGTAAGQFSPYIGIALIPVLAGALMTFVIAIFIRREDREYERMLKEAGALGDGELARSMDSIDESIGKIQRASDRLGLHTAELVELGRQAKDIAGMLDPQDRVPAEPETRSVTLGDNAVTNIRILRPVDEPVPPTLSPPLQSHQKIWFFLHR